MPDVPLANVREAARRWLALAGTETYRRALAIWCGVFCAGLFVLPSGWEQAALFYAAIPLTLPGVLAVARPMMASPLARVLTAFLLYSALSALWSDRWLAVGDHARRALCIWYFLAICCAIGQDGPERWQRLLRAVQIFAAVAAAMLAADYLWHCPGCERFIGYGSRANPNYTAHAAGAIALLGLTSWGSARGLSWRGMGLLLVCQISIGFLIVLTGSRTALLAYLSGVVLSVVLPVLRSGAARTATVATQGAVAAAACLGLAGGIAFMGRAWLAAEIGRGDTYRIQIWATNLMRIAERPWFGYGGNSADMFTIDGVVVGYHAHNLFLAQAFYGGVVGVVLWVSVFVLAARVAFRAWRSDDDIQPLVCLWFLFAVGMIDIGPVIVEFQAIWLYVWVILGVVLSYDVRRLTAASRPERVDLAP